MSFDDHEASYIENNNYRTQVQIDETVSPGKQETNKSSAMPDVTQEAQRSKNNWLDILNKISIPNWVAILTVVITALGYFHTVDTDRRKTEEERQTQKEEKLAKDNQVQEERVAREIAEDDQQHQILSAYIQEMTQLLLENRLRTSSPDDEVRKVARAITLNAANRLDGKRKGHLLRFLYEADLIGGQCKLNSKTGRPEQCQTAILQLDDVKLDGATSLDGMPDLTRPLFLQGVNLTGALLLKAKLPNISLDRAEMEDVKLKDAILTDATLSDAQMNGSILEGANLSGAKLLRAKLIGANLRNAIFAGADLRGANLSKAETTGASFKQAIFDGSTILPPEVIKEEMCYVKCISRRIGGV